MMTITSTTTATRGDGAGPPGSVGVVVGAGPVGMVVGPVDGDVVSEVGVGSAVSNTHNMFTVLSKG